MLQNSIVIENLKKNIFTDTNAFDLKTKAEYLSIIKHRDILFSYNGAKIKPLSHQMGAVHKAITKMNRGAILADEVGLGKTIEMGMILKEYSCRGEANRVLVLVPAPLTTQWRDELKEKFNEEFVIYNSKLRKKLEKKVENPWKINEKIICSLDSAKQPKQAEMLKETEWDIIVIDEAHRLKNHKTMNYKLVESLRKKYIFLLTATPLQNNILELYNLAGLLDSMLLGTRHSFTVRHCGDGKGLKIHDFKTLRQKMESIMIRNERKNVKDVSFTQRKAETVQFELSEPEKILYNAVTSYVKQEYLEAVKEKKVTRTFLLIILQRMLTSSSASVRDSLKRRILSLENLNYRLSDDIDEDYNDDSHNGEESKISKKEITLEKNKLKELYELASAIKTDTKASMLLEIMKRDEIRKDKEKVLIFTEFRQTQIFLQKTLESHGYKVAVFNGSMSAEEKDDAVEQFKKDVQVLICTEAGGEGRNLQFAHILINYDLPWNPMRVEQRIGRIHRIGQKKDVKIFNFATKGTIEEHVVKLLQDKIQLFHQAIGELDIILGEISSDSNFEKRIMDMFASAKTNEEENKKMEELGKKIEQAREKYEGIIQLDKSVMEKMGLNTEDFNIENIFSPRKEYLLIKKFFMDYLDYYNVSYKTPEDEVFLFRTPKHILKNTYLTEQEHLITFLNEKAIENEKVKFVTYGNGLLRYAVEHSRKKGYTAKKLIDKNLINYKNSSGILFNYKITYDTFHKHEEMLPVYINSEGNFDEKLSRSLNFIPCSDAEPDEINFRIEPLVSKSMELINSMVNKRVSEIRKENEIIFSRSMKIIDDYYNDCFFDMKCKIESQKARVKSLENGFSKTEENNLSVRKKYREAIEKESEKLERMLKRKISYEKKLHEERIKDIEELRSKIKLNVNAELVNASVVFIR
ncbi:MAG: SNF2-related protein [Candidatus Nanoarchaeia archaeon]|nr:SNF2-related protein [Candidatus Nanoarchaeia archaeon]